MNVLQLIFWPIWHTIKFQRGAAATSFWMKTAYATIHGYREALMESVAETSEEFMDRYFGGFETQYDQRDKKI